jgi:hypothetical protein
MFLCILCISLLTALCSSLLASLFWLNVMVERLTLLLHIREVPGSNLGPGDPYFS